MPLVGLGVIILWIGWFGFNGGSTFETGGSFFGEVMLNTQLAAAAGVIGASIAVYLKSRTLDVGMAGNGAIAGLVGITAPSGFVEYWAAPIIGLVAGLLVVYAVLAIDRLLDDPVGALSAHGLAGIWGTLSVGIFGSARLVSEGAAPGIWYSVFGDEPFSQSLGQLGVQALAVLFTFVVVFAISIVTFKVDQVDDRAPRLRGGGGGRPRHQLARDVRVSGAVHSPARVLDRPARDGQRIGRGNRRPRSRPDDRGRVASGGLSA